MYPPGFFVSVASKGFSLLVSLLFATLAGRFISVAAKGLKAIVERNRDGVGVGQWTVVSGEKDGRREWEFGASPRKEAGGPTRMVSENHTGDSTNQSSC